MIRILASIIFSLNIFSNITHAEILKANCIDEGDITKTEYKMFQLQINRDKIKLKWADDGWKSFKESGDYIYWDTVTPFNGSSITHFYSKNKGVLITNEFVFELRDRDGRQGRSIKHIFKCF